MGLSDRDNAGDAFLSFLSFFFDDEHGRIVISQIPFIGIGSKSGTIMHPYGAHVNQKNDTKTDG
ncbi:MAG: hypothetical protein ABIJ57_09025 [Pseudomonadota bacterium]